jgi:DNA-binding NarL/FixJ family response regulator
VSPVVVLMGSMLLAQAVAEALTRRGSAASAYDEAGSARQALRLLPAGVLVLHPVLGRRIDLSPMLGIGHLTASQRMILLIDPESEAVADATVDLPAHCRVHVSSGLDALVACLCEGRSRFWGRQTGSRMARSSAAGDVILPDGIALSAALAEVLRLHCSGHAALEIARLRGRSARTIETQMRTIRQLTAAENNVTLAVWYSGWAGGRAGRGS